MRVFLYLLLATFLFFPPAQSQTYYELPRKNEKADPTPEQIDEAFALHDRCATSDMLQRFYDCDCLSANFLDLRARAPSARQDSLLSSAQKKCANTTNIAGDAYQSCIGWATQLRTDYERFCACYANTYAKDFTRRPSDSIRGRERMMTASLDKCSTGNEIAQGRARQNAIDMLKRQGVYDQLFPGSKTDSSLKNQIPNGQ